MNAQADFSSAFQDDIPNYRAEDDASSSIGLRSVRVRVDGPRSQWIKELEDRFDEITSLPKGWDGYNGLPVSFSCAQFAANLIERLYVNTVPAPQIVPGSDGTLQIEWHCNQFDLEVDVFGPYDVVATITDLKNESEKELVVQTDFTELSDWVVTLGQHRN